MTGLQQIENSRPYISLILMKFSASRGESTIVKGLLEEISEALFSDSGNSNRKQLTGINLKTIDGLKLGWMHYIEEKAPSWLIPNEEAITDKLNHLLIVCRKSKHIAVYCSDKAAKGIVIRKLLSADPDSEAFSKVNPIRRKILTTAFVGGAARTLWLSGIHRRTAIKADSKILSGIRLQDALNPLDDQSYHFTAARSLTELRTQIRPVGLAPRKSNIWLSTSNNLGEFTNTVNAILERVVQAEGSPERKEPPLPILAMPVVNAKGITDAFDVSLIPPELLSFETGTNNSDAIDAAEKWAYRCRFEITHTDQANVDVNVILDDQPLGQLSIEVKIDQANNADIDISGAQEPGTDDKEWNELLAVCNKPGWLKIRYESGQTLSDGNFYTMQLNDFAFNNWSFQSIDENNNKEEDENNPDGTNPKKEKPTKPDSPQSFAIDDIGKQDSLFCWVRKNWFGLPDFASNQGWLACDDGAGEIADFIHLDLKPDDGGRPRLSLIHVKGSKSRSASRGISVSDYEVVCGQAVKNLRFIDRNNLAESLAKGKTKSVATAVWKNGGDPDQNDGPEKRDGMISALDGLKADYRTRVIVLQPRVRRSAHLPAAEDVRKKAVNPAANRLRQLNTLLLGTEADCRDLGADFHVISSAI